MHTIIVKRQEYYVTPTPTCFGLCWSHHQGTHNRAKQFFFNILCMWQNCLKLLHIRSRVQKSPAWHTKAASNGKCCEGYIVPSMVSLMYQIVVYWNKGRLCWKIAKLFYFCHLKKVCQAGDFWSLLRTVTYALFHTLWWTGRYIYSHIHQIEQAWWYNIFPAVKVVWTSETWGAHSGGWVYYCILRYDAI